VNGRITPTTQHLPLGHLQARRYIQTTDRNAYDHATKKHVGKEKKQDGDAILLGRGVY